MKLFVSKKNLMEVLSILESDSADQNKTSGNNEEERLKDFYWRCGNANAVDFIKTKLKLR